MKTEQAVFVTKDGTNYQMQKIAKVQFILSSVLLDSCQIWGIK